MPGKRSAQHYNAARLRKQAQEVRDLAGKLSLRVEREKLLAEAQGYDDQAAALEAEAGRCRPKTEQG